MPTTNLENSKFSFRIGNNETCLKRRNVLISQSSASEQSAPTYVTMAEGSFWAEGNGEAVRGQKSKFSPHLPLLICLPNTCRYQGLEGTHRKFQFFYLKELRRVTQLWQKQKSYLGYISKGGYRLEQREKIHQLQWSIAGRNWDIMSHDVIWDLWGHWHS